MPHIDANTSYRRKKFDRQKMKELFEVWHRASPITYTRSRLMTVLRNTDGCQDMYMWFKIMGSGENQRKAEISSIINSGTTAVGSSLSNTPRSASSLSPQPSGGAAAALAINSTPINNGYLPNSPYSLFFDDRASRLSSSPGLTSLTGTPGILKKRHGDETTRDSTPESIYYVNPNRPASSTKSIRFADDVDEEGVGKGKAEAKISTKEDLVGLESLSLVEGEVDAEGRDRVKLRGDITVEKYFDNLISMIEEAAEGL